MPLNIDALAAIDPSYRDLVEVRTRPAPQLGDWNAANIAEQKAFQLWTDKEPIPQFWAFWPDGEHDVWGLKIEPSPPVKPRVLGPASGAAANAVGQKQYFGYTLTTPEMQRFQLMSLQNSSGGDQLQSCHFHLHKD